MKCTWTRGLAISQSRISTFLARVDQLRKDPRATVGRTARQLDALSCRIWCVDRAAVGCAIVPRCSRYLAQPRCDCYLSLRPPEVSPPGSVRLDANGASRGTTLGDSSPENEAVPADGTKTNDHQSEGHDAPILPWGCSAFDVGDSCDAGAILAMRRGLL